MGGRVYGSGARPAKAAGEPCGRAAWPAPDGLSCRPAAEGPRGGDAARRRLARDDLLQATGTVDKILGGGRYRVVLDGGQQVTAQLSGRMRRFRIRVIPGDRVQVGVSPYDPTHGFITFRLREGQTTAR